MIKQISRLLGLQLKNFMNINVYANSKDIKKKKKQREGYGYMVFLSLFFGVMRLQSALD